MRPTRHGRPHLPLRACFQALCLPQEDPAWRRRKRRAAIGAAQPLAGVYRVEIAGQPPWLRANQLGVTRQQRAVIEMGQDVAREKVALGGMRVTGQDERLDAQIGVAAQLGQHLVRVADDRRAGT